MHNNLNGFNSIVTDLRQFFLTFHTFALFCDILKGTKHDNAEHTLTPVALKDPALIGLFGNLELHKTKAKYNKIG